MKLILRVLPFLLLSHLEAKQKDFYTFKVVNSRGRLVSLEKYRGSVSLALLLTNGTLRMMMQETENKLYFLFTFRHFSSVLSSSMHQASVHLSSALIKY